MGHVLLLLGSTALALLAAGLLGQRESWLGLVGAGAIANLLATALRLALGVSPWAAIGLLDPILWIFGACLVVFAARRGLRHVTARFRVRLAATLAGSSGDAQG